MTDSQVPEGQNDPSAEPEYKQLGDAGNPFSGKAAGIDDVPAAPSTTDETDQNPPLPDGGPTDGTHGVDDSRE